MQARAFRKHPSTLVRRSALAPHCQAATPPARTVYARVRGLPAVSFTMTRSQALTLILAATHPALGIGKNGALPWRLRREMKFFKQVTEHSVVVMGRRTWESIPPKFRPLSNRINIVVSSNADAQYDEGVIAAKNFEDALHKASSHQAPLFVIGGSQLYKASLPHAKRILLTLIDDPDGKIECDCHFEFDSVNEWKQQPLPALREAVGSNVEVPEEGKITENGYTYTFTLWERTA